MRDPDLVQRAERAAIALERAWDRWRNMHGLGSEPSPPVSSYVGYSLEEPWGQPRVVFGIGADEAERLAALLDGHDCVGPIYAEVTGRPDWRRLPASDPGYPARSIDDHLSIPLQAQPPAADMLTPASPVVSPAGIDESAVEAALPAIDAQNDQPSPVVAVGAGVPAGGEPDDADGEPQPGEQADRASAVPTPLEDLVPLPPLPDESIAAQPTAAAFAAAPVPVNDRKRTHGPGYRGPRYQGSPPQYKAAKDPAQRPSAAAGADADGAVSDDGVSDNAVSDNAVSDNTVSDNTVSDNTVSDNTVSDNTLAGPASQPQRTKPRQISSKLNRGRRQGPGAPESWDSADDEPAAGHAV